MSNLDATLYASTREFLLDFLRERQQRNNRFSLRSWSRQLGYKNPSLLCDVLAGRRRIPTELLNRVVCQADLNAKAEAHLWSLHQVESAQKTTAPAPGQKAERRLAKASPNRLSLEQFRVIADWQHLAILEFFLLADFTIEAKSIAQRLFKRLPQSAIELALERLRRVGLLRNDEHGKLVRSKQADKIFIGQKISSEAIRTHHQQFLELASEALKEQCVGERDFSGSTVAIKKRDLERIKAKIYQLHRFINDCSATAGDGEVVYRLNVHLFRLDRES